jgi:hypothetical protein
VKPLRPEEWALVGVGFVAFAGVVYALLSKSAANAGDTGGTFSSVLGPGNPQTTLGPSVQADGAVPEPEPVPDAPFIPI